MLYQDSSCSSDEESPDAEGIRLFCKILNRHRLKLNNTGLKRIRQEEPDYEESSTDEEVMKMYKKSVIRRAQQFGDNGRLFITKKSTSIFPANFRRCVAPELKDEFFLSDITRAIDESIEAENNPTRLVDLDRSFNAFDLSENSHLMNSVNICYMYLVSGRSPLSRSEQSKLMIDQLYANAPQFCTNVLRHLSVEDVMYFNCIVSKFEAKEQLDIDLEMRKEKRAQRRKARRDEAAARQRTEAQQGRDDPPPPHVLSTSRGFPAAKVQPDRQVLNETRRRKTAQETQHERSTNRDRLVNAQRFSSGPADSVRGGPVEQMTEEPPDDCKSERNDDSGDKEEDEAQEADDPGDPDDADGGGGVGGDRDDGGDDDENGGGGGDDKNEGDNDDRDQEEEEDNDVKMLFESERMNNDEQRRPDRNSSDQPPEERRSGAASRRTSTRSRWQLHQDRSARPPTPHRAVAASGSGRRRAPAVAELPIVVVRPPTPSADNEGCETYDARSAVNGQLNRADIEYNERMRQIEELTNRQLANIEMKHEIRDKFIRDEMVYEIRERRLQEQADGIVDDSDDSNEDDDDDDEGIVILRRHTRSSRHSMDEDWRQDLNHRYGGSGGAESVALYGDWPQTSGRGRSERGLPPSPPPPPPPPPTPRPHPSAPPETAISSEEEECPCVRCQVEHAYRTYYATDHTGGHRRKNVFCWVTPVRHVAQTGPNCGLAALSSIQPEYVINDDSTKSAVPPLEIDTLFREARRCGMTGRGEMFSARCMAQLGQRFMHDKYSVSVIHEHLITGDGLGTVPNVIRRLLRGELIAVCFDTDRNMEPSARHCGHTAHWAVLCGVVALCTESEAVEMQRAAYADLPQLGSDLWTRNAAKRGLFAEQAAPAPRARPWNPAKLMVVARHGKKSKYALWPLKQLAASNAQLLEPAPKILKCLAPAGRHSPPDVSGVSISGGPAAPPAARTPSADQAAYDGDLEHDAQDEPSHFVLPDGPRLDLCLASRYVAFAPHRNSPAVLSPQYHRTREVNRLLSARWLINEPPDCLVPRASAVRRSERVAQRTPIEHPKYPVSVFADNTTWNASVTDLADKIMHCTEQQRAPPIGHSANVAAAAASLPPPPAGASRHPGIVRPVPIRPTTAGIVVPTTASTPARMLAADRGTAAALVVADPLAAQSSPAHHHGQLITEPPYRFHLDDRDRPKRKPPHYHHHHHYLSSF